MIRSTLVCDGSSDRVLTQLIDWVLFECGVRTDLISQWADLRGLKIAKGLSARISAALDLYPCDILFVHRDGEGEARSKRVEEILEAVQQIETPPVVTVIPIRMQEAWLLCDEQAIRRAAGNPVGDVALGMPAFHDIENLPDPKETVFSLLQAASGKNGRRLRQFSVEAARSQIVEQMNDYSTLRHLSSFRAFEDEVRAVVQREHFHTWI